MKNEEITCPTCGKKSTWMLNNEHRPFCSARCKLIDLGDWASEKHRIAGDPLPPEGIVPSDENKE